MREKYVVEVEGGNIVGQPVPYKEPGFDLTLFVYLSTSICLMIGLLAWVVRIIKQK